MEPVHLLDSQHSTQTTRGSVCDVTLARVCGFTSLISHVSLVLVKLKKESCVELHELIYVKTVHKFSTTGYITLNVNDYLTGQAL